MAAVEQEFEQLQNHVHDLTTGQTLRMILLTLSSTQNFLVISIHHVNFDGVSVQVMLRDLEALYSRRHMSLLPPLVQYGDFAERQRVSAFDGSWDADLAFWRREFATIPEPLPLTRARIASRKPLRHYAINRADIHLDAALAARIRTVAQASRATAFHACLAAFYILLQQLILEGDNSEVCIGTADANRKDIETLASLGPYVNLLALRFNDRPKTFAAALTSARDKTYSALAHANAPFETVLHALRIARDTRFAPLFQAFIDYRLGARERQPFADCVVETLRFEPGRTAYDLSVDIFDHQDGGCLVSFFGQASLYAETDVEIFAACYKRILEVFVEQPGREIAGGWEYEDSCVKSALTLGRGPSFQTKWPDTLLHQLDLVTRDQGQKAAIILAGSDQPQTYDEIRLKVGIIATALLECGVSPGQVVAVYQDAGPDSVCSMLAIMKIGGVYVPLDPSTPPTRLALIVTDCQPAAVIVDNYKRRTFDIPIAVDVSSLKVKHSSYGALPTRAAPNEPALILYTSGTTGTPKGIVLKHSSFRHEVEVSAQVYGLDKSVVVLQQSALSFDMSVLQTFLALALGGTLCIVQRDFRADSVAISGFIVAHNVTYTCATPTEYGSWLQYADTATLRSSAWRVALSGGESVSQSLLQSFRELGKSDLRLFNGYGPTETTCCSTKMELLYQESGHVYGSYPTIPAGLPSANESIYIVDGHMRLLPPGLAGEVVIGGAGVAAMYQNNDKLTKEAFLPNPFATPEYLQNGWTTMYRTKDRGRLHPNGLVTVEGRISGDTQVKLRGVRIDLQDVENTILRCSDGAIVEACATLRGADTYTDQKARDVNFIVAHVVFAHGFDTGSEGQKQYLSRLLSNLSLPQYVRPSALVAIEKMPLTTSSKLDRRAVEALPLQSTRAVSANNDTLAVRDTLTEIERRVQVIWVKVLAHSDLVEPAKMTAKSDFFNVGGSSIQLLEVRAQIQEYFGVSVSLMQLFESSTLRAMSRFIECQEVEKVEPIDWEAEALPPSDLVQLLEAHAANDSTASPPKPKVIILTGAAGPLGRMILHQMLAQPSVGMVICIALRQIESRIASGALPESSQRLAYYAGDLRHPRLGLSQSDWALISSQVDAVVHVGADVSHTKPYRTLWDANVGSTIELARLCLQEPGRCVPLHFVSTAEVAMLGGTRPVEIFGEESVQVAKIVPSQENARAEGYASSKWVSERLLENLSGLRAWIHRPSIIMAPTEQDEAAILDGKPDAPLLRSVLFYSRRLRAVPSTESPLEGRLDLVGMETMARDVISAVLRGGEVGGIGGSMVTYMHHTGDVELALDQVKEHLEEQEKTERLQQHHGEALPNLPPFETLSLAEWVAKAQAAGMHPLLATVLETAERAKKPLYFPKFVKR